MSLLFSPLHIAAAAGNAQLLLILLDAGADASIEKRSSDNQAAGMTALMLAAKAGHAGVITALLSRGAGNDLSQQMWTHA